MDKDLKVFIIANIALNFLIGICVQIDYRKTGGCEYKSILSRIDIPYVAGCELIKNRWD